MNKDKVDEFFPHTFISDAKKNLIFSVRFKELNPSKIMIKKKLPPIKKEGQKKEQIIDDFADLVGGASNTSNLINNNGEEKGQKVDIDRLD